jgi:hypothetical protein
MRLVIPSQLCYRFDAFKTAFFIFASGDSAVGSALREGVEAE